MQKKMKTLKFFSFRFQVSGFALVHKAESLEINSDGQRPSVDILPYGVAIRY